MLRLRRVVRRASHAAGLSSMAAVRLVSSTTDVVYEALRRSGAAQVMYVVSQQPGAAHLEVEGHTFEIPAEQELASRFTETLDAWDEVVDVDEHDELAQTHAEVQQALAELGSRTMELERLRAELEETNKGVMALYAELDQHAEQLRRASEMKTKFLSNMSHEFRTPVSAILSLTSLLQDQADGALNLEQQRQVGLIERSAQALLELVSDLLDLARVEAGRVAVNATTFELRELFGGLRGMFRPSSTVGPTALVFERADALPELHTDEGKLSQILRNLLSNALKFTPAGEVRVAARLLEGDVVELCVADSGIGIALDEHERIFDEFTQIDSPLQRRHRGTGLGLPLSRKLARLLGGTLEVDSEVGKGSTFTVRIPRVYSGPDEASLEGGSSADKERSDE